MTRPKVLCEFGQTVNDSHETGLALLHQCAEAGAWGVKVQWLTPETIAHPTAVPYWATTRYAATQTESFRLAGIRPPMWYYPLRVAARKAGVKFVASVFDAAAVEAAVELDIDAIKIASGDITNWELIDAAARTGINLIISTGASEPAEIVTAVEVATDIGSGKITLLACSLVYPCPETAANVGRVQSLDRLARWALPTVTEIGYSDHTQGTLGAFAATVAGATLLEKHVRPNPDGTTRPIPDLDMAITPDEVAVYVTEACLGTAWRGAANITVDPAELPARHGARRAWYATRPLPAGHVIQPGDLVALRPWADNLARPDHNPVGGTVTLPVEEGAPILAAGYVREHLTDGTPAVGH